MNLNKGCIEISPIHSIYIGPLFLMNLNKGCIEIATVPNNANTYDIDEP